MLQERAGAGARPPRPSRSHPARWKPTRRRWSASCWRPRSPAADDRGAARALRCAARPVPRADALRGGAYPDPGHARRPGRDRQAMARAESPCWEGAPAQAASPIWRAATAPARRATRRRAGPAHLGRHRARVRGRARHAGRGRDRVRPVETRFGFHIMRLDARARGAVLPFEAVLPRLRAAEEKAAWVRAARAFSEDRLRHRTTPEAARGGKPIRNCAGAGLGAGCSCRAVRTTAADQGDGPRPCAGGDRRPSAAALRQRGDGRLRPAPVRPCRARPVETAGRGPDARGRCAVPASPGFGLPHPDRRRPADGRRQRGRAGSGFPRRVGHRRGATSRCRPEHPSKRR
jgi:hypothetical protein